MTVQAGTAFINITGYTAVFISHFRLVVFMAVNTLELGKHAAHMTFLAGIPFVSVFSAEDWEVHTVMIPIYLIPINGVMTNRAVRGETCGGVIGFRSIVFRLVTGDTIGWRICVTLIMTGKTIQRNMTAS